VIRSLLAVLLAMFLVGGSAAAQAPTGTTTTTTNPNAGAFDKLSPGNQKIAQALYEAQQTNNTTTPSTSPSSSTSTPKTLDDIAAMKQSGRGWGEIFKDLKSQGLVTEKNLGQVISKYQHQQKGLTPAPTGGTGQASTTQSSTTSATSAGTKGHGRGGYKSTGPVITSGNNQSSGGAASVGPGKGHGASEHGGGTSVTSGTSGSYSHGHGAGVTSGRGPSGGGPPAGSHGHGKP